MIKKVDI